MHRSRGSSSSSTPDKIFAGVRFVLFGFDSVSEAQYRSELVRRGGIDVGRYDRSCSHVIVSGRVYDDPVCVAARNDGKILVTELWIDVSLDIGMLADAKRILYCPVKDLNGIPGSKSLHICLTGYQRQEREDIMKMVSLMGAKFSKPLIANQVTHLICYKFEEILEAEAKDSDEETENVGIKSVGHSGMGKSISEGGVLSGDSGLSIPSRGKLSIPNDTFMTIHSAFADNHIMNNTLVTSPCTDNFSRNTMSECSPGSKLHHQNVGDVAQTSNDHAIRDAMVGGELFDQFDSGSLKEAYSLSARTVSTSSMVDVKSVPFSKKFRNKSVSPEESLMKVHTSPKGLSKDIDVSSSEPKGSRATDKPANIQDSITHIGINNVEATSSVLPQKRKVSVSGGGSKSLKSLMHSSLQHKSPDTESAQVEPVLLSPKENKYLVPMDANHPLEDAGPSDSVNQQSIVSKSFSCKRNSLSNGKPSMIKSSNVIKHSIPSQNQGLDKQECRKVDLFNMEQMATNVIASMDSKALPNIPVDNELMQVDDCEIMRSTANQFGSLAVGKHTDEMLCNDKRPEISVGGPEEAEFSTRSLNGENARIEIQNVMMKEPTQNHVLQQFEASLSSDCKAMTTRNFLTTVSADACKGNNIKVASGSYIKKVVAKRSLSSSTKLNALSSRKDKHVDNPDKYLKEAEVISGKVEKMKVPEDKKVSRNLRNGVVETSDEVMKERVEAAGVPIPASAKKDATSDRKDITSMDPEKENKPEEVSRFSSNCSNSCSSKLVNKHVKRSIQNSNNSQKIEIRKSKKIIYSEPAWFILSGHRIQRKDFQAVIRRLGGKICRDSHHWSYQATHFVAPDPVRRTEKFFAAAAAGRWILKTDYLTASCEAGKFLEEEPFEWYKKGLTEDGAISLEAPRQWRLLRERTGHGAFYNIRIIIYGECIAPTLDTLKRVVKAGDGTILATSPPYTRILKAGVDFAIVSPSMPRVDSWVQEFLRHEIPCVAADYLVEYVCKPGYSLEKHVLYKTHSWAEKSIAKLLSFSEEISEDARLLSEESSDDLSCAVCGSAGRGEVMLLCGDEAGTVGCGIGTHIDCCDPPLDSVPEGDWYCSKCSSTHNKTTPKHARFR
ncbi:BRCA1 C Terminus (BRCT) domain [Musa troglodytarum]|uniref:BRCA1 C Terminus (BRCT) domain n=1 Tax=Musa troglodytarum TaxID=320322 RepID=A0A9E7H4I2_9LILI|nr:BRCA1 C Terminus (BRCT) domain [Musa troglodytarum]